VYTTSATLYIYISSGSSITTLTRLWARQLGYDSRKRND